MKIPEIVPAFIDFHTDMGTTAVNGGKNHLQRHSLAHPIPVRYTNPLHEQANSIDIPRMSDGGYKVVFGAAFVAPTISGDFAAPAPGDFCKNIVHVMSHIIYFCKHQTRYNQIQILSNYVKSLERKDKLA